MLTRAQRFSLVVGLALMGVITHFANPGRVLEAIQHGDPKAADELLPLVYEELRKLAASKMANEAAGNTLQSTALVHEAWLRLVGNVWQKKLDGLAKP